MFHQDHCHPYAGFSNTALREIGLDDETIKRWQYIRNLLPNLQFLEGRENESKNCTPLKTWIDEGKSIAYMPADVSLGLADFETFFSERRKLIKAELMRIFKVH